MAPAEGLVTRDYGCGYGYYYDGLYCVRRSSWYFWGRWVLAGIAIFIALVVLVSCICVSRRNRKKGAQPMYGTGWMSGSSNKYNNNNGTEMNNYQNGYNQGGYGQQQYGGGYGGYPSPPPYGQPQPAANQMTGTTFNPNDGYYSGQQQYGVQQPPHAYQPDSHYQAPAGPPPGK